MMMFAKHRVNITHRTHTLDTLKSHLLTMRKRLQSLQFLMCQRPETR